MEGAACGALIGAGMLSWYPDPYRFDVKNTKVDYNIGFRYVMRNLKAPIAWSAIVCSVYSLVDCTVENMRDESHASTWVNSAVAGAAAGVVIGSMSKRLDVMATTALGVGTLMGMVEFNGQHYVSDKAHAKDKWEGVLPPKTKETSIVEALKEKYPEFKGL